MRQAVRARVTPGSPHRVVAGFRFGRAAQSTAGGPGLSSEGEGAALSIRAGEGPASRATRDVNKVPRA